MTKKISKTQAGEQIHDFFHEIRHKSPKDVKKNETACNVS